MGNLVTELDQKPEGQKTVETYQNELLLCLQQLQLHPENFNLLKRVVSLYLSLSNFEKVIDTSNIFIRYFPQHPVPYFFRCRCYLSLQQYDLADAESCNWVMK